MTKTTYNPLFALNIYYTRITTRDNIYLYRSKPQSWRMSDEKVATEAQQYPPPLRLNYVASFAIRSIPHYPDGRYQKLKRHS